MTAIVRLVCYLLAHPKASAAYLRYLARHKWYVLVAGEGLGVPLRQLLTHDLSKFRPSEFVAYCDYYYRRNAFRRWSELTPAEKSYYWPRTIEDVERDYEAAWLHHTRRNRHHWQYWLLANDDGTEKALPMPFDDLREMLADWVGANRALGGNGVRAWYTANAAKIRLDPGSRAWVEARLGVRTDAADAALAEV